ncbi:addiction module antidote protein [Nitratidesulfovibrio sp. D1]|uniref:addiction module antidote protein n=1 Tax=Nitratidesulfovibrio sp. D1 TaxID=3440151 RepID=UPI003EB70118
MQKKNIFHETSRFSEGGTAMSNVAIREYETARYLDSEEMIAEYLAACLEDPNPDVFLAALGEVAKARGVAQLAKETGLSRESLYKTFSPGTKPRFETILKITNALGVPLGIRQSGETAHLA